MNEVINNILTRRSVRAFSDQPITRESMELLIEAGMYAPSGMNLQTWKFIGVLNQEKITELATVVGKAWDRPSLNFYSPTALIIISNEKESRFGKEDNAAALQNIFLAAHSLEIGSVWINQLNNGTSENPEVRAMLNTLGVPENHTVFGIAALGYLAGEAKGKVEKTGKYEIIE